MYQQYAKLTSFLEAGLSTSTRCVKRGKPASASKSASSTRLFDDSTRFLRLGIAFAREGWMLETRFLARRRVVIRGDRGKFPKT